MKKVISILSLLMLTIMGSCGKKDTGQGNGGNDGRKPCNCLQKTLKVNLGGEPSTLDPRKARTLADLNLVKMFMEGLYRIAQDGKASFALAKNVEVSKDQLTYTFHLKKSQWSNGEPVTAHDFIYAWKKVLSPNYPSSYAAQLYPIKNAKTIKEGKLPLSFLGVDAVDDHTLVVELQSPCPYFLELTALPIFFPVNAKLDKTNPKWAESIETFTCNGPFQPKTWNHHDKIVAEKNEIYWDKDHVALNEVEMIMVDDETGIKMFENGELHFQGSPLCSIPADTIDGLKKLNLLKTKPFQATYWISVNTEKAPLNHVKLRKALSMAVDRNQLTEHITKGGEAPAHSIVPNSMKPTSNLSPIFTSISDAKALFEEALGELQMTTNELPKITLTYSNTTRNHLIAQYLQDLWRTTFGLHIELEKFERKVFFSKVHSKDYQMATADWIADFNDPITFLNIFSSKKSKLNATNWQNKNYKLLLKKSFEESDQDQRQKLLAQCEEILMEEVPVIPLFHHSMLYVQDHVDDLILTDSGNIDFKWATVN